MEIEALKVFLIASEKGSILGAAEALGLSRGAVRRKLEVVEERAGVELFVRNRSGLSLTPAGVSLASNAGRVLKEVDSLMQYVHSVGNNPTGVLRVCCAPGVDAIAGATAYKLHDAMYPELEHRLDISPAPLEQLLDPYDMAIVVMPEVPDGPWEIFDFFHAPLCVMASEDYLEEHGCPTSAEELAEHTLLAWDCPGRSTNLWPRVGGGNWEVKPRYTSNDWTHIQALAVHGVGICLSLFPPPFPTPYTRGLKVILEEVIWLEMWGKVVIPKVLLDVPRVQAGVQALERAERLRAQMNQ